MQRIVKPLLICAGLALSMSVAVADSALVVATGAASAPAVVVAPSASTPASDPVSAASATVVVPAPEEIRPVLKVGTENLVPSAVQLESGQMNYVRYCADCHGKDGEGKAGPKLVGSLLVTGPVYGHISIVLNGHSKTKMPTWGISEISDDVIASVITYQRNAWGNNNKKEFGRHAGGVVTPDWVHVYRKMLKNLPVKQEVRT